MKYSLSIETLTPLHISSGTELIANYDYISSDNTTYILNQDRIYAAEYDRSPATARLHEPAARLIRPDDLRVDSPFVDYTLMNSTTLQVLREQIKDVQRRCYLPGSSLKGAVRTALAQFALEAELYQPETADLGRTPKEAGQQIERALFGRDPNHSIFRALEFSDSAALPQQPSCLQLCPVAVFTGNKADSPIAVEAVRKGITFQAALTIDELALRYRSELEWQEKVLLLADLPRKLQAAAYQRILAGKNWAVAQRMAAVEKFYDDLLAISATMRNRNAFIIQLGWGTGWQGTSLGLTLPLDVINEARLRFKLGKPPKAHADSWEPDLKMPFPKTRRLQVLGERAPLQPLGWVAVVLSPVGAPQFPEDWVQLRGESRQEFEGTVERLWSGKPAAPPQTGAEAPISLPTPVPPLRPVPLTKHFFKLPEPGDRFRETPVDADKKSIYLDVPGREDTDVAVLALADNPQLEELRGQKEITCRVLRIEEEKNNSGHYLVFCQAEV